MAEPRSTSATQAKSSQEIRLDQAFCLLTADNRLIGPFNDQQQASHWAEANSVKYDRVTQMQSPEDYLQQQPRT